jgi:hypothetical protein
MRSMTELRFSVKHSAATIPTQETKKIHNGNRKLGTICRCKHGITHKISQADSGVAYMKKHMHFINTIFFSSFLLLVEGTLAHPYLHHFIT